MYFASSTYIKEYHVRYIAPLTLDYTSWVHKLTGFFDSPELWNICGQVLYSYSLLLLWKFGNAQWVFGYYVYQSNGNSCKVIHFETQDTVKCKKMHV